MAKSSNVHHNTSGNSTKTRTGESDLEAVDTSDKHNVAAADTFEIDVAMVDTSENDVQ